MATGIEQIFRSLSRYTFSIGNAWENYINRTAGQSSTKLSSLQNKKAKVDFCDNTAEGKLYIFIFSKCYELRYICTH